MTDEDDPSPWEEAPTSTGGLRATLVFGLVLPVACGVVVVVSAVEQSWPSMAVGTVLLGLAVWLRRHVAAGRMRGLSGRRGGPVGNVCIPARPAHGVTAPPLSERQMSSSGREDDTWRSLNGTGPVTGADLR